LWLLAAYILFFTTLIEDTSDALDNFGNVESAQVEESVETPQAQIIPIPPPTPKKSVPAPCDKLIKGNVSSSGDKIYHVPGEIFMIRPSRKRRSVLLQKHTPQVIENQKK